MSFLVVALLMVLVVAGLLGRALLFTQSQGADANSDIPVYISQLEEVDRDVERGILTLDQAESVRAEVGRRLLAAEKADRQTGAAKPVSPILSFGIVVLALLGGTAALYAALGSFGMADLPLAKRIAILDEAKATRPSQQEAEAIALNDMPAPPPPAPEHVELIEQLRAVIAERPDDLQGLRLLARQEGNLGNYVAAREHLEKVVALQGDAANPQDLAQLFDVMIFNTNDYISPEAEAVLLRLRQDAPELLLGQFYEGMLHIQSGRPDLAFPVWRSLLEQSPPEAPWFAFVDGELEAVAQAAGVRYQRPERASETRGPSAGDIAAAQDMSDEERQAMIEGMVASLTDRLAAEGGTVEEWQQLIRALVVLDRRDDARSVLAEAMQVFATEASAMQALQALFDELRL